MERTWTWDDFDRWAADGPDLDFDIAKIADVVWRSVIVSISSIWLWTELIPERTDSMTKDTIALPLRVFGVFFVLRRYPRSLSRSWTIRLYLLHVVGLGYFRRPDLLRYP